MSICRVVNRTPPHWLVYVAAGDVDALTKKAMSLGGKTCAPPQDIPNVGRFSIISDRSKGAASGSAR